MDCNLVNISSIETFLDSLLRGSLSKHLYFTSLPKALKKDWNEMVLVDVGSSDNDTGIGMVNVFLYARPIGDSEKNVKALSQLEKKLNDIIKSNTNKHYFLSRLNTYSDYDYTRNLYVNVVSLVLHIY